MDAALKLVAVVAAVTVILLLVTGRLVRPGRRTGSVLAGLRSPSGAPGFPAALVAATGAATALSPTGADPWQAGALIGLLAGILASAGLGWLRKGVYGAAAVAGAVAGMIAVFQPVPGCARTTALDAWFTVLLAAIAALAAAGGWLTGHTPTAPQGYFSAITVLGFLASPLGVPVLSTTDPALAAGAGIAAAAVLGYAAGRWPGPVIGLASLAIALTGIAVAAFIVPACSSILNGSQATILLAFAPVYVLVRMGASLLTRR
ncbi:hypothetical protein GCM10012320_36110 [Sinomonas cellulolyticus]|uniref:Uncharacterized protein n=1 Tax=Sinomonas cellulolyticus TaxID=2801916 RepID=A0ABS1K5U8_9MICC|nr:MULTISPECIES: hypothetical protein [Sinomonas]MBL0707015.1 hypothetical protein [Sinomonas cellulolyticus]GHG61260.1 hypothetical protein GCM10012320_36110 [Sinomonas sp. KCTC 49339]